MLGYACVLMVKMIFKMHSKLWSRCYDFTRLKNELYIQNIWNVLIGPKKELNSEIISYN